MEITVNVIKTVDGRVLYALPTKFIASSEEEFERKQNLGLRVNIDEESEPGVVYVDMNFVSHFFSGEEEITQVCVDGNWWSIDLPINVFIEIYGKVVDETDNQEP